MNLQDFIITPVILLFVYVVAYLMRPAVTDKQTSKYFIPGLTVKIIGAITVGFIYQFYYGGGDTFAFHTHGSRIIWEAFMESPIKGIKLLLATGEYHGDTFDYASRIWYFRDQQSYMVIRIAAFLDLFTLGTYSATAVLFAVLSFSGMWALFKTFYHAYPALHLQLAIATLFVPSVFFWGSGILKDSISLGCLGWMTYIFYRTAIKRQINLVLIFVFLLCMFLSYSLKKYILLSFLPGLIVWYFATHLSLINSTLNKILLAPFMITLALAFGYLAIVKVGEDDARYSLDKIAQTAKITAYDIRYGWGARFGEGSGYSLGELDGTFAGMIKLMPAAINVSLFRPYLWEVKNPLMLLSAIEALVLLILTLWFLIQMGLGQFVKGLLKADVLFCMTFALTFAFAVGISTYNFGTLARYKIPLIPFYLIGLFLLKYDGVRKSGKPLQMNH